MTCNWIKLCIQHGIRNSSQVMDSTQLLQASIVHSGYKKLARTFTGANSWDEREAIVYEQYHLKTWFSVTMTKYNPKKGDLEFQEKLQQNFQNLCSSVPIIFFEVGVPSHSVGLALDAGGGLAYLFDPNYGLFEYDMDKGFPVVKHHLERSYPPSRGSEFACTFTAVTPDC
jgi:hypothetical protein